MTFTSLTFALFLPFVFAVYWLLRTATRQNLFLIVASYVFYGWWDVRFCLLILLSSLIDFEIGRRIHKSNDQQLRKILLVMSLVCNLGLLMVFKYFNFFAESFAPLAAGFGWQPNSLTLNLILPVGISFYTFQTLSYTIDIYRKKIPASKSLADYLAFVSFFPQLVAGPVERAADLLPQFAAERTFENTEARRGCRLILWGFFKKIVLADRLAIVVDQVYGEPAAFSGPVLALATLCFAFQIYCDFSAYSDIAIGTARLFGIRLTRNFAYPYFSQSIGEFWRRWHISMSSWFRDYVYIPLGGSRAEPIWKSRNVLATFLLSGLWHGAGWQFLAWGGIHGGAVAGQQLVGGRTAQRHAKSKTPTVSTPPGGERFFPHPTVLLRIWGTFFVVCVCWIFFRAESLPQAFSILGSIATDLFHVPAYDELGQFWDSNHLVRKTLPLLLGFVLIEWAQRHRECPLEMPKFATPVRWGIYTVLIWGTLYWMAPNAGNQFIYFEF